MLQPSTTRLSASRNRCALVVGHPGHELTVFGWMCRFKPRVFVITDGSGRSGISRIPSTVNVLKEAGVAAGEIFGYINDAAIYRAIYTKDISVFRPMLQILTTALLRHEVTTVLGDAAEGYNPTHDICRVIINSAVRVARRHSGRSIANYEMHVAEWPAAPSCAHDAGCSHLDLDDERLERKIKIANAYAELQHEVEAQITARGRDYFRRESIHRVSEPYQMQFDGAAPHYETWGEKRVAEGHYPSVIRYRQHMVPLIEAIESSAENVEIAY